MKKFLTALLCAAVAVLSAVGLVACGGNGGGVSVYMPDGATALSMAKQMVDKNTFGKDVNYHVVNATQIASCVSGENPVADICVLPLNVASKVLGDGETYQMLGTVTHGNLYVLKKQGGVDITLQNLETLVGKTVGVVQLAAVPGLTFQLILKQNNVAYQVGEGAADKVNLKALSSADEVTPASACDYFVVAEPAATTKVNKTTLEFAGDLQSLYGGESGYPQAVLVAKRSLIESDKAFINSFIAAIEENSAWLNGYGLEAKLNDIVGAINKNMPEGSVSTINANNLNAQVIEHCAINFVKSADCKAEVTEFLNKLIGVNATAASTVEDKFFYIDG